MSRPVVVVTGGAQGIGAACVRRFASEGASVIVADLQMPPGELPVAGFVQGDVADEQTFAAVRHLALAEFGRLDTLVSNAHAQYTGPVEELTLAAWQRTLDVGLTATFLGVRTLAGELSRSQGCVVAVSSVHARASMPHFAAYAAAKGGLDALVRQLAVELGGRVRVNAVLPGPIRTAGWSGASPDQVRTEADRTAMGRFGEPDEVAAAIAFLASSDASFITGTCLTVDGGWSVRHR